MLEQYYRINKATGISVTTDSTGNTVIHACSIHIENNQLNFEVKVTDAAEIKDVASHFPVKYPVALNLSGKAVLIKQAEKIEEVNANNFSRILPNANIEDFYVQNFISGDQSFIAVIRKAEADKWISTLSENGFNSLMLTLGPFPVQHIISQLNIYDKELTFNGNLIERDEQSNWTGYRHNETARSPFPLKVGLEPVDEKLIIPYAAAFQLALTGKLDVVEAGVPALEAALREKLSINILKVRGSLVLGGLFILLLVNYLLFSSLYSSNIVLAEQVSRSAQSSNDIQGISDMVKQKEGQLQRLGWDDGINKSNLIDQIASLLPADITWKEVALNPIDISATRMQKSLVFADRKIRVTGNSQKIIPVNEWMARVKTKTWVKKIQLESYIYNTELNTGQFTVIIDY